MAGQAARVELTFTALPAHVRTARLVATALARRSGVDESLLDEVRLAVGEACSRAVAEHLHHCPTKPVRLILTETAEQFEVEVTDSVISGSRSPDAGGGQEPDWISPALPVAVIAGLVDEVNINESAAGTSIRMTWPTRAAGNGGASPGSQRTVTSG